MDHCKEPISLRTARLFKSVITRSGPMQRSTRMKMTQDALLDAFILLYDECCKEWLKKDVNIVHFVNKYRSLVTEIKSLRVNLSDFKVKTVIGRGHFGEVKLVQERQTNDVYAMKILKKCKTLYNESAALFEEEHDIMCSATSPWLTSLQYSFQDYENLYFVMEYHPGGDLLTLFDRYNGKLVPQMAKFYLAETCLAIRALHQMGYVHRDIKPDNILLDRCGHVKLVDFGSAARLSSSGLVTQSMPVGTPEYVAPEILMSLNDSGVERNKKHCYGMECDYWSLGILAYEMVVGKTPFSGTQLTSTYFNIMNHKKKVRYPENVTIPEPLQDLIDKLLEDASLRLKHEGLVKHEFFRDIDWNNIRNEVPPFVPSLSSPDDASNFTEMERRKATPTVESRDAKKTFSGDNLPFIGFSYSQDVEPKSGKNCKLIEEKSSGKKSESLETILAVTKKEKQELVSKLFEAQYGRTGELETFEKRLEEKTRLLELCEAERNKLQREVAKAQAENSSLRRTLDLDRQERMEMEANALNLIKQNKVKLERDVSNRMSQLQSKIEELNDKLTESHTVNNELASKCDRMESELSSARKEIEKLKSAEATYKSKMAKAREFKRQSVVGIESRLEQMANENQNQTSILQQKLNDETKAKIEFEERVKEIEAAWSSRESQLLQEIKDYEEKISELETKNSIQHRQIASLQVKVEEKLNVAKLEQQLEKEREECSKLRTRIINIESELTNTTHSFTDHESAIAAHEESLVALEKEYRQVSDEKLRLLAKLEETKKNESENKQKLSNLKVVIDRLEQSVIKLEEENVKLKQLHIANIAPLTTEAETRYQEKITILEDQNAKLEHQVQQLREAAVLEKKTLESTQLALWKAEKELSNAKLDKRIAEREAKTAEDLVNKLQGELKKVNEKLNEAGVQAHKEILSEREKFDKLSLEMIELRADLNRKEIDIKMLKGQLEDMKALETSQKRLKKDYNELGQQCKILEKQVEALKEEKEKMKKACTNGDMDKLKLEKVIEELKHKNCSLEINNTNLKETIAMLDEQLEDYDKFTTGQAEKIDELTQEKAKLERDLETIKGDLRTSRQSLNEEKSFKIRAEQRVKFLEQEMSDRNEQLNKLQKDAANANALVENLKRQVDESDKKVAEYDAEISEWKRMYDSLNAECQWLKQEATSHLTQLYKLKESNYQLTRDLEEEQELTEALKARISELQNIITELETYHKHREVKDEATKQQQNKLITFLQAKLDDQFKKKKTITDVLFGSRTKENVPPSPAVIPSPPSSKKVTDHLAKHKATPRELFKSPTTKQALSQLVKSPTSQSNFQRQISSKRMHHNIPHRFKNQLVLRSTTCGGCHGNINRGSQSSVCNHCGIQAHPKCSVTIPKTCGLPDGFAKHYAKTLADSNCVDSAKTEDSESAVAHEGWIKVRRSGKLTWERKYAVLDSGHLLIYEHEPKNSQLAPLMKFNLRPEDGHVVIGESLENSDLPNTAKSDLPYIIKIAIVPNTTCWPQETHYLMVLTPSDKPAWLGALNSVALKDAVTEETQKYRGSTIYSFVNDRLDVNCVAQINEKLVLMGAEQGLYSLKLNAENKTPVKIAGVSKVGQIALAPQIGLAVMIAEESGSLVECDHRALVSNAEAASCSNPSISVRPIDLGSAAESCLMFAVSHNIDGVVYMTAATSTRLIILRWCVKNNQFLIAKVLETLHPCNCVLYGNHSVIVGCDKVFEIDLKDFAIKEFLNPSVKSLAFWRFGSFPIQIFQVSKKELLICFNEFGVFVDEKGDKTQPDLKWSKVPCDFVYCSPYLYVIHMSSVEVITLPRPETRMNEDSISIASTATIQDSIHIGFDNPRFLGRSKFPSGIYLSCTSSSSLDVVMIEGDKVYKRDLGSCLSLATMSEDDQRANEPDGDEFSFTSSIVQSIEGDSNLPNSDDSDGCITYTLSDNDRNNTNKKVVTFVQHAIIS